MNTKDTTNVSLKKELTLGQGLGMLVTLATAMVTSFIHVQVKLAEHELQIRSLETRYMEIGKNAELYKKDQDEQNRKVIDILVDIQLKLKDKQDRKN